MKLSRRSWPDPEPDIARCLELVGVAREILVIGAANQTLLARLDDRGCNIACVLLAGTNADEARVFCSAVHTASAERLDLTNLYSGSLFDVIVFDGALELFNEPVFPLAHARNLLGENGRVIVISAMDIDVSAFIRSGYQVTSREQWRSPAMDVRYTIALALAGASFKDKVAFLDTRDGFNGAGDPDSDRINRSKASVAFPEVDLATLSARPAIEAMSAQTVELHQRLEKQSERIDQLRRALSESRANSVRLRRDLAAAEVARRKAQGEFEIERAIRKRMEREMGATVVKLASVQQEAADTESAWYALCAELEQLRARLREAEADAADRLVDAARSARLLELAQERLEKAQAQLNDVNSAFAEGQNRAQYYAEQLTVLERRLADRESQIEQGEAHTAALLQQLAAKDRNTERLEAELEAIRRAALADASTMQEYANDVRERSERLANELRGEVAAAADRERRTAENFNRQLESLRAAELRLQVENRELRERVTVAEGTLAAQADSVVAAMQAESAQLSKLVDTVQSSSFWRLKRWLGRLRGAHRS